MVLQNTGDLRIKFPLAAVSRNYQGKSLHIKARTNFWNSKTPRKKEELKRKAPQMQTPQHNCPSPGLSLCQWVLMPSTCLGPFSCPKCPCISLHPCGGFLGTNSSISATLWAFPGCRSPSTVSKLLSGRRGHGTLLPSCCWSCAAKKWKIHRMEYTDMKLNLLKTYGTAIYQSGNLFEWVLRECSDGCFLWNTGAGGDMLLGCSLMVSHLHPQSYQIPTEPRSYIIQVCL